MAHYRRMEESFEYSKTGNQLIKPETEYVGLAVTMSSTKNTVELSDANDEIVGSITGFSRDGKQVRVGIESHGLNFRNGGATAITVGAKIVGSQRTVDSVAKYGYVKAPPARTTTYTKATEDTRDNAKGIVRDGGGVYAADAGAEADVIVQFPA